MVQRTYYSSPSRTECVTFGKGMRKLETVRQVDSNILFRTNIPGSPLHLSNGFTFSSLMGERSFAFSSLSRSAVFEFGLLSLVDPRPLLLLPLLPLSFSSNGNRPCNDPVP